MIWLQRVLRDPVAAHADAELDLENIAPARANVYAALSPARSSASALRSLWSPYGLTGWFAAWVTGLPTLKMVVRNLLLRTCAMTAGLIIGHAVAL
jgi:hypothetical protein